MENDSLESTARALRYLNEASDVGTKTAEELVRQGEQLNNIEQRMDDVNQTLTSTQKNLNMIKSVFGGVRNKFFNWKAYSSTDMPKKPDENKTKYEKSTMNHSASLNVIKPVQKAEFATISGSDREKEINKNLDEMSLGLSRLASLAKDMNFELDKQNNQLNRLNFKSEATHSKINDQNAQIKKVLK